MSFKNVSDVHAPVSGPDTATPSEGCSPAKVRVVEPDAQAPPKGDSSGQAVDPTRPAPSTSKPPARRKPTSSPCTCRCNGCCCHGTSPEPRHCVRCHTNYTLNHPEACALPHVFTFPEDRWSVSCYKDVSVAATCCGSSVCFGHSIDRDWDHPFPCFVGWHTTDLNAVVNRYNGVNFLRCDLDSEGNCSRAPMKHSLRFRMLYDEKMKYTQVDKEDYEHYLKKKWAQSKDDKSFEYEFIEIKCPTEDEDSEDGEGEDDEDEDEDEDEKRDRKDKEDAERKMRKLIRVKAKRVMRI